MRILILHDYLSNIGGGEKLMLSLARGLKADFATLDYDRELVDAMGFSDVNVLDLGSTLKLPPLKQVTASIKHRLADFTGQYDRFIVSGNWAHYAAARHHPNLWYCHTPVRAFYSDYESMGRRLNPVQRLAFKIWVAAHRHADQKSIKKVDKIVVNSDNTRARVKKYYGRESTVVYPGIDTKRYSYEKNGDFWLSVNRLYPEKRIHLQVEAFRRLPDERLVIVGGGTLGDHSGCYAGELMQDKPANVEYRGRVTEEELVGLYGGCKAFIATAADEDFGMTPVEAMAAGKPVVAVGEGGYLESVVDGETGVFASPRVDDIVCAVKAVGGGPAGYRRACERRAAAFDIKSFLEMMRGEVERI